MLGWMSSRSAISAIVTAVSDCVDEFRDQLSPTSERCAAAFADSPRADRAPADRDRDLTRRWDHEVRLPRRQGSHHRSVDGERPEFACPAW